MRLLGSNRQQPRKRMWTTILPAASALLVCVSGTVWAASGGDSGHGGFTSTDWFRVMNFAVLFAVLFYLLRKPIPRALNSRIQGIQDQLNDLEAKKAEAEKQLAEYNQKLGTLEKEAERIMAETFLELLDADEARDVSLMSDRVSEDIIAMREAGVAVRRPRSISSR